MPTWNDAEGWSLYPQLALFIKVSAKTAHYAQVDNRRVIRLH
ncbi:hypothetical protein [Vibrio nigripulchritudo]|nr:hypothetical protein [Vibrio nigripulchritudo]